MERITKITYDVIENISWLVFFFIFNGFTNLRLSSDELSNEVGVKYWNYTRVLIS